MIMRLIESRRLHNENLREFNEEQLLNLVEKFDTLFASGDTSDHMDEFYSQPIVPDSLPSKNNLENDLDEMLELWSQIKHILEKLNKKSEVVSHTCSMLEMKLNIIIKIVAQNDDSAKYNKTVREISRVISSWRARQEVREKRKRKKKKNVGAMPPIPIAERRVLNSEEIFLRNQKLDDHIALFKNTISRNFHEGSNIGFNDAWFIFYDWWEKSVDFIKFYQQYPELNIITLMEALNVKLDEISTATEGRALPDHRDSAIENIGLFLKNEGNFWWHDHSKFVTNSEQEPEFVPEEAQAGTLRVLGERFDS